MGTTRWRFFHRTENGPGVGTPHSLLFFDFVVGLHPPRWWNVSHVGGWVASEVEWGVDGMGWPGVGWACWVS